jgi:KipI family sensor histidine kinase inhibitor
VSGPSHEGLRVRPFGDGAVLVETGVPDEAQRAARVLDEGRGSGSLPGVEDVVLGYGTVTVRFDPRRSGLEAVLEAVSELARRALDGSDDASVPGPADPVELDVRFDGPDLDEVAARAGWTAERVVEALASARLRVAFVGFSPGFAYLHGLPPELAAIGRRSRPRPVVPAGSVAIAAGFAAVYPQATPGGWHLVGRSGAVLFDPDHPPYAVLSAGREVRFRPTDVPVPDRPTRRRPAIEAPAGPGLLVERAGSCTLVEDAGRVGVGGLGVPRAGAMDDLSLRLANRLAGNDDTAAALEVTASGPALRAVAPLHVVVLGAPWRAAARVLLDGRGAPAGEVLPLAAGSVLEAEDGRGGRVIVAPAGGVDVAPVLGSRSSDLLCGLGPGALRPGDVLPVGVPGRPRGWLRFPGDDEDETVLRVLPGPDASPPGRRVVDAGFVPPGSWVVAPDSNRVGVRLRPRHADGGAVVPELPSVPSRGMVRGAVQCPPGGELVVLGPDHATVGGYPVPAVVVTADLHRLAHLVPGSSVRFVPVVAEEARRALARLDSSAARAVGGWFPTRAG